MDKTELWRTIRAILRVLYVIVNNLYCIPTYAIWMAMLSPLIFFNPDLYWYIEGQFFKYLLLMVASWGWTAGHKYYDVGEDVSSCFDQECVVIVNHQSTGDVPSLMTVLQNKSQIIPRMLWIMDRFFKWTNFGLVSAIHGDFFIRAGKDTRDAQLVRLKNHLQNVYGSRKRQWIVLFPEGGFLRKRIEVSQRFARKNNLPHLEHVSLPRAGALHTIVNTLHPSTCTTLNGYFSNDGNANHFPKKLDLQTDSDKVRPIKWAIDITIGYPNVQPIGLPSTITMLTDPCKIFVHYRKFPIEEVPLETTALTQWLYDRFQEKEELLKEFYQTGTFPLHPNPREIGRAHV